MGWTKDRLEDIAFLQRRADVDSGRIGGLGLSVGGEMMIQTAAETSALKAVASEGDGMRSLREAVDTPSSPETWLGISCYADVRIGRLCRPLDYAVQPVPYARKRRRG